MKLVIDGVLDQNLPWAMILIGVAIAGVAALFKVPVLAFAPAAETWLIWEPVSDAPTASRIMAAPSRHFTE